MTGNYDDWGADWSPRLEINNWFIFDFKRQYIQFWSSRPLAWRGAHLLPHKGISVWVLSVLHNVPIPRRPIHNHSLSPEYKNKTAFRLKVSWNLLSFIFKMTELNIHFRPGLQDIIYWLEDDTNILLKIPTFQQLAHCQWGSHLTLTCTQIQNMKLCACVMVYEGGADWAGTEIHLCYRAISVEKPWRRSRIKTNKQTDRKLKL